MKNEIPQTGYPVIDSILMVWSALYSVAQTIGIGTVDQGIGVGVGLLTAILLIYRIALAHDELFETNEQEVET